jgi:5'-nucleotidase
MRKILFAVILLFLAPVRELAGQRPHILLTNDDGIEHEGIRAMFRALIKVGTVTVAAPSENQSAIGHTLQLGDARLYVDTGTDASGAAWHSITAKPADTLRLALAELIEEPPDIVVSGSNRGQNLGPITFISGTLAGAREAAFYGIPAIAVSIQVGETMDYDGAAEFTAGLVRQYLEQGLPDGSYLSVNYPALPPTEIKGSRIVRHSLKMPLLLNFSERSDGQGRIYYAQSLAPAPGIESGTDWSVLEDGFIAITPMHLDQTHHDLIPLVRGWRIEP